MRSLNTSLPRTSPRRTQQPPEELLSAFKAAALSVTNLYKSAASEQARARAQGYQDAMDDLLSFLDKQNLGLGDGEGWRVRQWATERFDGRVSGSRESDDEDEEDEDKARSSSPEAARKPAAPVPAPTQEALVQPQPEPIVVTEAPPFQQQPSVVRSDITVPQSDAFTFRSSLSYPSGHDREVDMDSTNSASTDSSASSNPNNTNNNPVRLEVHSRRRNNHNRSNNANRTTPLNLGSLGSGAGAKRKIPFGDFFDIGGMSFGNGRDGSDRGGKRGRHV